MICSLQEAERIQQLQSEGIIRFSTEPDPSGRHCSDENDSTCTILHRSASIPLASGYKPLRHLEIWSQDTETAELALRLVYIGALLGTPDLIEMPAPIPAVSAKELSHWKLSDFPWWDSFRYYRSVDLGCAACIASLRNQAFTYALEKHYLSLRLDWFTSHSASPVSGLVFPETYSEPAYHITAAFSIIAAFSVIEELGLEIRASKKRPRFTSGSHQWNPQVLNELDNRLQRVGLSAQEEFVWIVRGKETTLRSTMKLNERENAWQRKWRDVGDRKIILADAIHYAGWLRNKISAHRFAEMTADLGPYEVHNCQRLARYLLMAGLGLLPLIRRWEKEQ